MVWALPIAPCRSRPSFLPTNRSICCFVLGSVRRCSIVCVPPFTRDVIRREIGLVLARELRPLVPGHPLPLSSLQRIQWHVCGGRRGQDGSDRADAVCVSCHGDIPGRLCRLIDRKWYDDYPV